MVHSQHFFKKMSQKILTPIGLKIVRQRNDREDLASDYVTYDRQVLMKRSFLNIGAGSFSHPYWTNIDHHTAYYNNMIGFVEYDLLALEPLPIEDASIELIYVSHVVEHIPNTAVQHMLNEAYRVLKPGGGIRLLTPDAELEYRAYQLGRRDFFYWINEYSAPGSWEHVYKKPLSEVSLQQIFLHHFASQICEIDRDSLSSNSVQDQEISERFSAQSMEDALNFFTARCVYDPQRAGNHINWFSKKKLSDMLYQSGFSTVYRSGWRQSLFKPFRNPAYFDSTHPEISLFMEAIR